MSASRDRTRIPLWVTLRVTIVTRGVAAGLTVCGHTSLGLSRSRDVSRLAWRSGWDLLKRTSRGLSTRRLSCRVQPVLARWCWS